MPRFLVFDGYCRQPLGYVEAEKEHTARGYLDKLVAAPPTGEIVHECLIDRPGEISLTEMDAKADVTKFPCKWSFERRNPTGQGTQPAVEEHRWNLKRLGG